MGRVGSGEEAGVAAPDAGSPTGAVASPAGTAIVAGRFLALALGLFLNFTLLGEDFPLVAALAAGRAPDGSEPFATGTSARCATAMAAKNVHEAIAVVIAQP